MALGAYPPGAANDPRAPYNHPSIHPVYHQASIEVEIFFYSGNASIRQTIYYEWLRVDEHGIEVWVQEPDWINSLNRPEVRPDNFAEDFTQAITSLHKSKIYQLNLL